MSKKNKELIAITAFIVAIAAACIFIVIKNKKDNNQSENSSVNETIPNENNNSNTTNITEEKPISIKKRDAAWFENKYKVFAITISNFIGTLYEAENYEVIVSKSPDFIYYTILDHLMIANGLHSNEIIKDTDFKDTVKSIYGIADFRYSEEYKEENDGYLVPIYGDEEAPPTFKVDEVKYNNDEVILNVSFTYRDFPDDGVEMIIKLKYNSEDNYSITAIKLIA